MREPLEKYVEDDDGAVTVDWVVITGFVIGLALSVATALSPGMEERGTEMLSPATILTTF